MNIALLINIFFWILVGLLLGFVLLSLNIQHLLERLIIFLTFLILSLPYYIIVIIRPIRRCTYISGGLQLLVQKNLAAHRIRNRRTAVMYSLSLAFVLFILISYDMQIRSSSYSTKQSHGAYLELSSEDFPINHYYFDDFIATSLKEEIDCHSWITHELNSILED